MVAPNAGIAKSIPKPNVAIDESLWCMGNSSFSFFYLLDLDRNMLSPRNLSPLIALSMDHV